MVNSFVCCGLSPQSTPGDITCMKSGRPAESGLETIQEFWFDTKKSDETATNEINQNDMIHEDIPELIIDEFPDPDPASQITFSNVTTNNVNTNDTVIVSDSNEQDDNINNINNVLCGTCPEVPYNIATNFCSDCNENICGDCSNGHRIFRLTRDHDISPL